ncbi:hypothetical protein PVAP13_9NG001400 [Panicum virgatum]|uniref:Uncharacterized protein n=1 Tax=Panicum virgatum TaxID=38727 RepID=A0A8T0MBV4_PANVG|nr:hypothetical protein PVAP13_9NG001400 [Panicum virgatum]
MSTAVSDSLVDAPVESAAGLKTAAGQEEVVAVVDARKAFWINLALDVFFVVYLMYYIFTLVVFFTLPTNNWWDPWPCVFVVSPICIGMLCLTPKMKVVYTQLYATKWTPRNWPMKCELGAQLVLCSIGP